MDAITLLTERGSSPQLTFPGPTEAQLSQIVEAGLRAPDHGGLTPWEFLIAEGEGLNRLGDILFEAAKANGVEGEQLARARLLPTRAPMVITIISRVKDHPKVPPLEQHLSAGCAAMAMQMAAQAQGLGGMWRTGSYAFDDHVRQALGVRGDDQIIGFLYLGTPKQAPKAKRKLDPSQYLRRL